MTNILTAHDLHRVLATSKLFTGTDDTLPMLRCVRLEFTSGRVIGVATDRFTLGVITAEYVEPEANDATPEVFDVMVDHNDVDTLIKLAKTPVKSSVWRTVDVTVTERDERPNSGHYGNPVTIEFRFNSGETVAVRAADYEFPKYRQLIPSAVSDATDLRGTDYTTGFNPGYLAKFAKVLSADGKAGRMAVTTHSPSKPTAVRIGDDFIGLIMPVRLGETDLAVYSRPAWLDTPAAATAPVTAVPS
jgi:DNA polymerase III sliding clamp (beta) subunit (PCNA family)